MAVASTQGPNPAAAGDSATDRFTHPDEVAGLVACMASDVAGTITGSDVVIDDGPITTT